MCLEEDIKQVELGPYPRSVLLMGRSVAIGSREWQFDRSNSDKIVVNPKAPRCRGDGHMKAVEDHILLVHHPIHVCIHFDIHTHIHFCIHAFIHVIIHIQFRTYIFIHICIYIYDRICIYIYVHLRMHNCIHFRFSETR